MNKENSLFEAIINSTQAAVKMIVGIAALLIAVLGLVALIDIILGGLGHWINPLLHVQGEWSLKGICGVIFYPLTLCLGIPLAEAGTVACIIGERLVVTEVVAYHDLAAAMADKTLSMRSAVITTYALCGFAHIASMSIFVGGLCALAPNKTRQISQVAVRALVGATLACLMTACVAGIFYSKSSILFSGTP